jgi:HD superfamily phosphohydrolase
LELAKTKLYKEYKIRDPIYGFIRLDNHEMEIVNSRYFQRLRRIKQLSLTDMVYPGATHTRFEHSLGTMQMASDMFDCIVRKERNLQRLFLRKEHTDRLRKIVRIAALLHDIGHAPFSHSSEDLMPISSGCIRYNHEHYSISIIKLLFRDLIENHPHAINLGIKAEDVTSLLGDSTVPSKGTSVIWKELISSQFDADRADYLLRDSLHTGVNYGLFDRNRLINCVTIGESAEASCFLAIEEGGWHIAESIVLARYQMFSQVYYHPVRRAFDYHLGQAIKQVLRDRKFKDGLLPKPTSERNLVKYLSLDDWEINNALKHNKCGKHGKMILDRMPYKCKKEWDNELSDEEMSEVERAKKQYDGFLDSGAVTKWYKLDKDNIWVYNEKTGGSVPLSSKSKIISVMPGLPKKTRLYINQQGEGANYEFGIQ